jgi:O-antigen/teichoic acid export membrane protein
MGRTRKAAILAAFTYAQFGLAIVTGIVLVPLVLRHLGSRTYGLWLTTGELLAYAAMVELGVLGVLPWMFAQADGSGDRVALRRLVSNGLAVGAFVSVGFLGVAICLWRVLPSALRLTASDRAIVGPPLFVMAIATAITYPLRVYRALLAGLQDVVFNGALGISEAAITAGVTIVMLLKGYGVYALACAAAAASLCGSLAALARTMYLAPDLLWQWTRPTLREVRSLFSNGVGGWFGALGWQVIAASNSIVITYIGHPEWVPIYSCTARLSGLFMQLGWVLPDSGLIGLAQLSGEEPRSPRLAQRVRALLQLHLLLAGAAACGVLAFNPAFVSRWVGESFFGGLPLNAVLAMTVVSYSIVHGVVTVSAVLGQRLQVGMVTLAHAAFQVACAIFLGHRWGLLGVASAVLLSTSMTSLPAGLYLLQQSTSMTVNELVGGSAVRWLRRSLPLLLLALVVGVSYRTTGVWTTGMAGAVVGAVYLWQMRSFYHVLPLDPLWTRWLISLRLMPSIAARPMEQS